MVETRGADYALEYVAGIPEDEESMRVKREMMGRVAGVVATQDPEAAIAFATRYADTEAGTKLAYYLVSDWARRDGPAAIEWATTLRSRTAHKVVERAWRNFLSRDPDAAVAWMEGQPKTSALEPAYALYLQRLAREDDARALELSADLEDPRRRLQVWQAVGRRWIVREGVDGHRRPPAGDPEADPGSRAPTDSRRDGAGRLEPGPDARARRSVEARSSLGDSHTGLSQGLCVAYQIGEV
jgi:hypothetical protein